MNKASAEIVNAFDTKALRRCLGSFATGVAVITTRHGERDWGITVNSFTSLSLDPPLVLWCLARSSRTYAAFTAADQFTVNVLAVDQVAVSNRFAFRSSEDFPSDVPFRRATGGVPVLEGVCSHFRCRRVSVLEGGDHVIFVGEVVEFAGSSRAGLVYAAGHYAVADAHPTVVAQSRDRLDAGFLDGTVRPALEGMTRRFESFFDEKLREAGVTSRESQILGLLLAHGPLSSEAIANQTLVTGSFLQETLESLLNKNLIAVGQSTYELSESGRLLADEWYERLRAYKAEALGPIAVAEAERLQRTLARLSEWIGAASLGSKSLKP
jgi:flavin reductase (DIM6/NTAB) family NADH-FMN oxidoreductase RutF/DNA-binding MarR family transcriptional regulator